EAAGLIKRAVRMNRSNLFYINAAELLKQAQGVFDAKAAKKKEAEISPFEEVEFEMAAEDSEDEGFGGGAGWEE
ncbi:MAG: hypothetical protein PW735_08270, partial [Acidobacteriaceae bacterium]|nr:hypothetical protein [Acidobacteriaceae bacterium]